MSFRQDELSAGAATVRLFRLLEKLGIWKKPKHISLHHIQDYAFRVLWTQKSDTNQPSED